jgi:hyperosmotically inducible periplasmic protein
MHTTKSRLRMLANMFFPMLLFGLTPFTLAAESHNSPGAWVSPKAAALTREVRQQLGTLNYYAVFDDLTFRVESPGTVVLAGEVTRPGLKSDAEAVVLKINGVDKVVNQVEVLPESASDDSIRWAAFRAIFDKPELQQYAVQQVSPLRIIVKNGQITLDGKVASQFDKKEIEMSARSVPDAAGVIDNLVVE